MSKLYCAYSKGEDLANHRCDICGKLLCKICGYQTARYDFCNECWENKELNQERLGQEYDEKIRAEHGEEIMSPKEHPDFYKE